MTGCQTPAPQKALTAEQIAVLKQQGFELTDEGWAFGLSGKVLFGSDLEVLNAQSQEIVERIGTALLAVDMQRLRVDGHTDFSGQDAYNQHLSVRRANSVVKVLTNVGMRPENIEVRGLGSSPTKSVRKPHPSRFPEQKRCIQLRHGSDVIPQQRNTFQLPQILAAVHPELSRQVDFIRQYRQ